MAKKVSKSMFIRRESKIGLPPGSLVYTGKHLESALQAELIQYNAETASKSAIDKSELPQENLAENDVLWLNCNGLNDVSFIRAIGNQYKIHNLWLEDILNVDHIPKIEVEDNQALVCFRMMRILDSSDHFEHEQVSIFKKDNLIITFQEREGDVFEPLRKRILEGKGKVRERKSDYLLYLLMDAVVDQSFSVLHNIAVKLDTLENDILNDPKEYSLAEIGRLRKENINFKRFIVPLEDSVIKLITDYPSNFNKASKVYYKDLRDHLSTLADEAENQRESIRSLLDLYMNLMSLRMNKVMKNLPWWPLSSFP